MSMKRAATAATATPPSADQKPCEHPVHPVPPVLMRRTLAASTSEVGGAKSSSSSQDMSSMGSLEEVLEKQWEMGAHFFMEQAQHFDIASLLSCLHKLKRENLELEDKLEYMQTRRNNLLAVNARLVAPLGGYQMKSDYRPPSSSADLPEQQPPRRQHRS